jgi:hypothetical protein
MDALEGWSRRVPLVLSLIPSLIWSLAGCAGGWSLSGQGEAAIFLHAGRGYSIGVPEAIEGQRWGRIHAEGTELAFVNSAGATLSLQSLCQATDASDQLLARNLLIGLSGRSVVASAPWNFGPWHGWAQTVIARSGENEDEVRLRTFTLRRDACVLDWLLVTPVSVAGWDRLDAVFDAWVTSFRDANFSEPATAAADAAVDENAHGGSPP